MKLIAVGDTAPDFTIQDDREDTRQLSGYAGKKILLSWHPLAWTPVCTDQMRSLENNWQAFAKFNTIPLGFVLMPSLVKKPGVWQFNSKTFTCPLTFGHMVK